MVVKPATRRRAGRTAKGVGTHKLLGTLIAVAMLAIVGVVGTRAAISATTDNPGNQFNAGTIDLADNDGGTYMYQVNNVQPGESISRCIKVTYTGSLNSTVKLFMDTPLDTLAPYVDMSVDVGTQATSSFPNCTGFTSTSTIYSGTLSGFQSTYGSAASGLAYSPNGATPWQNNDSVVYQVTLTLQSTARPAGADFSGTHTYTWQADSA
jgi:Camelysin metallo-endopeptidase